MHIYKIIALCIAVGLVSVALLLYSRPYSSQYQPEKKTPPAITTQEQTPQTSITFSPSQLTLTASGSATIQVQIATGPNKIAVAQLEVRYDPSMINITDIRSGNFFPSPTPLLNTHDRGRGRIDYVLSVSENTPMISGEGHLATLIVTRNPNATGSGTTRIDLLPKTSVRGQEKQTSLLKSTGSSLLLLEAITTAPSTLPL